MVLISAYFSPLHSVYMVYDCGSAYDWWVLDV